MHILVAYRGIPQSPGWAVGDSVVRTLRKMGHYAYPYGRYYQTGEPLGPVPAQVELVLYLEMNDPDHQYLELHGFNLPRVYWEFDTSMHWDFTRNWLDYWKFDRVFFGNPAYVDKWPGAEYLPYAVDPSLHHPGDGTKTIDAAIIGHPFGPRVEFAKAANVELIGGIYRDEYVKAIQQMKVHVHNHASGGEGLLVFRIWETLGCGTCLLTEYDPTLLKHFKDGVHCVVYRGADDCRKKLKWLLENNHEREKIARQGLEEIQKNHLYENRLQVILDSL